MPTKTETVMRLTLLSFICVVFIAGCSSTQETFKTSETISIEPIKFEVPKIEGKIELPLVKADTLKEKPYGIYEGEKIIETQQPDGTKTKATAKIKAELKKDSKGNPFLDTKIEIKQDSVSKPATIKKKTEQYEQKKESKGLYDTFELILYIILGIAVLSILGYFMNLFPKKS